MDIVGVSNGRLLFKVNGQHSPNGDGRAKPRWSVHWKVRPNIAVKSIDDIKIKPGNSTNIFSSNPPTPQGGSQRRHWKGIVDSTVGAAEYDYSIFWLDNAGNVNEHDPKISVDPKFAVDEDPPGSKTLLIGAILGLLGLLTLGLLRSRKRG